MIWTEKEYGELTYLFQLSEKLERQLQNIYKTNSTEEWELLNHTYEEEPVGCDYKNCPRANPKNGITEVFHIQNKKTGELLCLGVDCYLKLIYDKEELTEKEKKESKSLLRKTKKIEGTLLESIQETKQYLRKKYYSFKMKLERLENPSFYEALVISEEQFSQANLIEELKRLAKLLEISHSKYLLEMKRIKNRRETCNDISKYHIKKIGEKTLQYNALDKVELKDKRQYKILRIGGSHIKMIDIGSRRRITMTIQKFNKKLVGIFDKKMDILS